MPDCSSVQRSLAWCQGKPELPGVKRRIYYISKYDILHWPVLQHDANGRLTSAAYAGDFVLRADAKWKFIDIISDKSQLTSDAQGEYPSQTQLNKLVAVHPGVDEEASAAAAYLNNNDNVFLIEDMRGAVRVVGSDKWPTKTTVTQDLGQGATGSTSTTINVEATDECPAPFYAGIIATEEGDINPNGNPNQNTGDNSGSNTGNNSGSNTGNNSGTNTGNNNGDSTNTGENNGSSSSTPSYNNSVQINGQSYNVTNGGTVNITGNLTSLRFTGSNMLYMSYKAGNEMETEIEINSAGTVATSNDVITAPNTVKIYRHEGTGDDVVDVLWFTINLTASSSSGGNTSGGSSSGGSNTSGGDITYDNIIRVNGLEYNSASHSVVIYGALTSINVTGTNLSGLTLVRNVSGRDIVEELTVSQDKTSASWAGNIAPSSEAWLKRIVDGTNKFWITIHILNEGEEWVDE